MFCKNCGKEIDDNAVVCTNCGVATDNMYRTSSPITAEPSKSVNGFAIAALVLSIVGLFGGNYLFMVPSIVGLILGIIGMVKSKQYAAPGLAIAALVVSIVAFVIWFLIWIFAFWIILVSLGMYY